MAKLTRQIDESPIYQGEDETIPYALDTSPWGGSPSGVSVVVKLNGEDVSANVVSGSPSVSGDDIGFTITGLADGSHYRLEVLFTTGSAEVEAWAELIGQE